MERAVRIAVGQRGFSLVEVLVAIVVFSLGVLGLIRLQGTAVRMSTDARQRAEATFLADQLLARMLIADSATAASFAHKPDGNVPCSPTGPASANPLVAEWLLQVEATLPRAAAAEQQVIVSTGAATDVTVRLCWKNAAVDTPHTFEVTNRVQWP